MARDNRTEVHRNINKTLRGGRKCDENSTDPSCTGFVEMMAPVYSRASWRCIWHLIQSKFWSQRSTSSSDSDIDTDRESETAVVTEISTEGSCYRIDVSDASDDKEDDPKRVLKSAKVKHFDEMMLRLTN
ncbi:hypothetical protein ACFXTO_035607 [Malus domestica]